MPMEQHVQRLRETVRSLVPYKEKITAENDEAAGMGLVGKDEAKIEQYVTGKTLDGLYFIIGEEHDWGLRSGYKVTWFLEPAESNQFWLLGEAGFSELGETTFLGL